MEQKKDREQEFIDMLATNAEKVAEELNFNQNERMAFILGWLNAEFKMALITIYSGEADWYRRYTDYRLSKKEEQ